MADLPPYPDSNSNTGVETNNETPAGLPRWVKVFGIIATLLLLLFIILHFTIGGPGNHGPRSNASERGLRQP